MKVTKCISLWQPWASAMAINLKKIETRGWATSYRGLVAIHASLKSTADLRTTFRELVKKHSAIEQAFAAGPGTLFEMLPLGQIVSVGELVDCVPVEQIDINLLSETERALGDYSPGRFGWFFKDMRPLKEPMPYKGRQGLFSISEYLMTE